MLISQPYIKISRNITNNKQFLTETAEDLSLYKDKIVSASDQFNLHEVLDLSYRSISSNNGFLYLHTIRGVYPYQIKTDPSEFIRMYQQLKK